MTDEEKQCSYCHLTYPLVSFTLNKEGNYHKCCNICLDKRKKYYEENKSRILMRNTMYRKTIRKMSIYGIEIGSKLIKKIR